MSRLAATALGLLATLALAGCAAQSQPQFNAADETALRDGSASFAQGIRSGDFASVAAHYTADAVFMPPNGPAVQGRGAIESWMSGFPPVSTFELQPVTIAGSGDLAFVHGTYTMTIAMPDGSSLPDHGKYIEIYRRQPDGSWLMTHDIFNSDVPIPDGQ